MVPCKHNVKGNRRTVPPFTEVDWLTPHRGSRLERISKQQKFPSVGIYEDQFRLCDYHDVPVARREGMQIF